ncbi:unnamed protein product, partial [Heterosigma akashiwo]
AGRTPPCPTWSPGTTRCWWTPTRGRAPRGATTPPPPTATSDEGCARAQRRP